MDKIKYIRNSMNQLNLEISDKKCEQFLTYYEMLVEKNKVMNLTAITEFKDVVIKHFVDSVSLVKSIDVSKFESIVDVGTGAGFPGIPIKIMYPNLKITLVDSLNKRLNFLNEVICELNLDNVNLVHGRAEDIGHNKIYREQFDLCVSRAVANISTLSEYCIPLIKVGGSFICYKTENSACEIEVGTKAINIFGADIVDIIDFELPELNLGRKIVNIEKISKTPNKYPRKAGTPSKEPIC